MSKKITPSEVNKLLKKSGTKTPSHYRDGAVKTERSVDAVVTAAGKTRDMVNLSAYDMSATAEEIDAGLLEGAYIKVSVSDRMRARTASYWSKKPNQESMYYVKDEVGLELPFDIQFNPLDSERVEKTKMDMIGSMPETEVCFEEAVHVRPNSASPVYNDVEDPTQVFKALLQGGSVKGRDYQKSISEGVEYEDNSFVISSPYSLRDIERFTTSINTMYASVKPTYNFYIPEYETATSENSNNIPEPLLPNMYVMLSEMLKSDDDKKNEWFNRHITLNNSLRMETQSEMMRPPSERRKWEIKDSLAVQYFDMYGRQVHRSLSENQKLALAKKFSNIYASNASVELIKNYNSRKELFPMFVDIEFSTDQATEFAEALKESGMGAHMLKCLSSYSLTKKTFAEDVRTAVQAASEVTGANEVIVRSELRERKRRVFDVHSWYTDVKSGNKPSAEGFFDSENSVFLGKNDPMSEVTDDPKYALYKSLMTVVFSSKIRDLVRARTRTYKEMMSGKKAHSETVFYRIEKRKGGTNGTVVQNFWLPNSNEIEVHNFIDTQVKYGRQYTYVIYAYELVFGSKYKYSDFWVDDSEAGYVVQTRPSLKIVEVPYYSYTNRLADSPPVMPDVEIISYRAVADRVKINFSSNVGKYDLMPQPISKSEDRINKEIRKAQDRLDTEPIRYESDDHAQEFEVFRVTSHPYSYLDFEGKKTKTVLTPQEPESPHKATSASHVDFIEPNKKYWYTFRSVDVHGNVSYPTPIYQVEMIDDHGSIYPIVKVVEFASRTPKAPAKQLKRMMQVVPTFAHGMLNEEKSGLIGATSVADRWDKDTIFLGVEDESLWGKKFKIRLTSRKTGRKIDVNVEFGHEHLKNKSE